MIEANIASSTENSPTVHSNKRAFHVSNYSSLLKEDEDIETPDKYDWYDNHKATFLVDLSKLNEWGGFAVKWGAHGSGSDDWMLGETNYIVEVLY